MATALHCRANQWVYGWFAGLMLLGATCAFSQPSAITPEDVSRLRQLTHFSWDWSNTDAFDLDNPVSLQVTIQRVVIPEVGNAELLFTLSDQQRRRSELTLPQRPRYHAILQSAEEVRRLGIRRSDFVEGLQATLTGWPATERNVTPNVLLIDEIEMGNQGRRFKLQDHPHMQKHRKRAASSAE